MFYHVEAILYKKEPMPHNVLFCATFGGFLILSLAGMLVPLSGQLSPPGVDTIFCFTAFVLLYTCAIHSMYYITTDPHLKLDDVTDVMEAEHIFFKHCLLHCKLSLITGTFFLMHGCISADRLHTVRRGLDEEAAEIAGKPLSDNEIPIVDISPETPITLHLFMLDYCVYLYNTKLIKGLRRICGCTCLQPKDDFRRKSSRKKQRLTPHQRAALKAKKLSKSVPPQKGKATTSTAQEKQKRW